MEEQQIKNIVEAGLLVAGKPLNINQLHALFQDDKEAPEKADIRKAVASLQEDYEDRGIELVEVSSGFRLQSKQEMAPWMIHLFQEKAPRYSRALLETLVLIAYKQPITRAEIEEVRGVAVSSNIVRTLQERNWVNVVGHKDLPGKPALLGTTRQFLDYFNLKRLDDLPTLSEIKDIDQIESFSEQEAALIEQGLIQAPVDEDATTEESVEGEEGEALSSDAEAVETDTADEDTGEELSAEDDESDDDEDNNDANFSAAAIATAGVDISLADDADVDFVVLNDEAGGNFEPTGEMQSSDVQVTDAQSNESIDSSAPDNSPEAQLKQVLADFSTEHQEQVDAQQESEARNLSKPVGPAANNGNGGVQIQAGGESQEAEDTDDAEEVEVMEAELETSLDANAATKASDMPKPSDTLH